MVGPGHGRGQPKAHYDMARGCPPPTNYTLMSSHNASAAASVVENYGVGAPPPPGKVAQVRTTLKHTPRQGVPNTLPGEFPRGLRRVRWASRSRRESSRRAPAYLDSSTQDAIANMIQHINLTACAPPRSSNSAV